MPVEVFDARLFAPGWQAADFDDGAWGAAQVVPAVHIGGFARTQPPTDPYGPLFPRTDRRVGRRDHAAGVRTCRAAGGPGRHCPRQPRQAGRGKHRAAASRRRLRQGSCPWRSTCRPAAACGWCWTWDASPRAPCSLRSARPRARCWTSPMSRSRSRGRRSGQLRRIRAPAIRHAGPTTASRSLTPTASAMPTCLCTAPQVR